MGLGMGESHGRNQKQLISRLSKLEKKDKKETNFKMEG